MRTVDTKVMLAMALSIATGLAHLHMDIVGTRGKFIASASRSYLFWIFQFNDCIFFPRNLQANRL